MTVSANNTKESRMQQITVYLIALLCPKTEETAKAKYKNPSRNQKEFGRVQLNLVHVDICRNSLSISFPKTVASSISQIFHEVQF